MALSDDSLPSLEDPEVGNASDSQERAESSAVEHFPMLVTQLRFGAVSAGVPIFQTLPSDDESGISSHGMSGSGVGSPSPKKGPGRARRLPPQRLKTAAKAGQRGWLPWVRWSRSSQGCIGWQARSASGGACVARRCRSAMEHLQKWHNSK